MGKVLTPGGTEKRVASRRNNDMLIRVGLGKLFYSNEPHYDSLLKLKSTQ